MTSTDDYGHCGQRRVTIDRAVFEELTRQAEAYRDLAASIGTADRLLQLVIESPGVRDLLMAEYADWTARQSAGESATAISAATAGEPFGPGQAVLQQRRQQLGALAEQFRARHGGEYRGGPVDWITGRPARSNTAHAA